jgi:hypothetical protein
MKRLEILNDLILLAGSAVFLVNAWLTDSTDRALLCLILSFVMVCFVELREIKRAVKPKTVVSNIHITSPVNGEIARAVAAELAKTRRQS